MKIKTLLIILGITVSQNVCFAQKKEFKFGKIAPEEFAIKATGLDSAAAAIKIFDVGNCYFQITSSGFSYVFERHFRYKVLNKNGYDYANYSVPLYRGSGGAREDLYGLEAATYNMIDGKMVASKISKDAKFTESFNKNYSFKKFALPNVKEGSILEYKYSIKSDFIFNLRGWSFQSDVPTLYTEYNVTIPDYLIYKRNVSGILPINQTKHVAVNDNVSGNQSAMEDQFVMTNVPALKEEAYITTLDDYRPSIDFELTATRFPGEMYKDFTGTWPKIVNSLVNEENFGSFIGKNSYAKTVLPDILKGEKDTLNMVKLIYNYVKQNLKWDDGYSVYTSVTNPKNVFEKKTGNSADINLSLVNLLKEAKITAIPALVSTRENGTHPGYPILSKFNNVIVSVWVNNKNMLLDATNKDLEMGMVSYQNLNHQALLVNLSSVTSRWITTEPVKSSERNFIYNLSLDKENKLKGTLSQYSKGYSALKTRNNYKKATNEAEFIKDFKKEKTGLQLANYKIINLDNYDELLTENMEVVIEDNVEEAGNLVYFTPLLFEKTKENPFKHDKRDFPVDFAYPTKEIYRITVAFPEEYDIDKLPTGGIYKIPNNKGTFTINFLTEGKTLMVKSVIDIAQSFYTPEEYFELKELFKSIVQKHAEQIVFKKKS
jgi:hypothetical protein